MTIKIVLVCIIVCPYMYIYYTLIMIVFHVARPKQRTQEEALHSLASDHDITSMFVDFTCIFYYFLSGSSLSR